MDSLECAIVGDPALLKCLAPYKTWIDRNGQSASLTEIVDKWQGAQDRVSQGALVFPKKKAFSIKGNFYTSLELSSVKSSYHGVNVHYFFLLIAYIIHRHISSYQAIFDET